MFENGTDVLMPEIFEELYVLPESRRVQFQPKTENEPAQPTEPVSTIDNGNR